MERPPRRTPREQPTHPRVSFAYGWEQRWQSQHCVIQKDAFQWEVRSDVELSWPEIDSILKNGSSEYSTRRHVTYNGKTCDIVFGVYTHNGITVLLVRKLYMTK